MGKMQNILFNEVKRTVVDNQHDEQFLEDADEESVSYFEKMTDPQQKILWQKKYFEALFKNSTDAIVLFNEHHEIVDINQKFVTLFNYSLEEIRGRNVDEVIGGQDKLQEANDLTRKLLDGREAILESVRYGKGNIPIEVGIKGVAIIIEGKVVGGYGIYTDITKRKEAERQIIYISYHDKLTGTYNRAFFEEELKRVDHIENLPITIIIGDANGLKMTNDAFGHEKGDEVLKYIAAIFMEECEKYGTVARVGGDEFVALLSHTTEEEGLQICQNIKKQCGERSKGAIQLSVSLGIASKTNEIQSLKEVYKIAENRMYNNKLLESKSTKSSIITSLQRTLEERTHETEEHGNRLVELSLELGKRLALHDNELNELKLLAPLHDIGKIATPDHILTKKGSLTEEEWQVMKKHSEIGYRIANASPELVIIAEGILHHHEWWDGTGYPQGLKGLEISQAARIISIVDAYDAMTSDRSYRKALSREKAIEELKNGAGKQFDPHMVTVFLQIIE